MTDANRTGRLTRTGAFAFALTLTAAMANANQPPAQGQQEQYAPPPPQAEQRMELSDTKLRQFSSARAEVQSVQREYSQAIQSTQEEQEAQALREEAQQAMVDAVEESGLSVSEYNQISQRARSDEEIARRLERLSG
jgi:ribosome recycling factor